MSCTGGTTDPFSSSSSESSCDLFTALLRMVLFSTGPLPSTAISGRPPVIIRTASSTASERDTEPLSVRHSDPWPAASTPAGTPETPQGHFCNIRHFSCPVLSPGWLKGWAVVKTNYKGNAAAPAPALPLHRNWGHLRASIKQEGLLGIRVTSSWFTRKTAKQVSLCFSTEEASKIPCVI